MSQFENLIESFIRLTKLSEEIMRPREDSDFNPGVMFLLFMIYTKKEIKTTEIADHFGVTGGAATGIADKLEKMGLIERKRKDDDRRVVVAILTEKGQAFVEERKKEHIELYQEILKDLSHEEITNLIFLLNKIGDKMQDYINK
jgi:DNA-binding MarR family transcriptional regulator